MTIFIITLISFLLSLFLNHNNEDRKVTWIIIDTIMITIVISMIYYLCIQET